MQRFSLLLLLLSFVTTSHSQLVSDSIKIGNNYRSFHYKQPKDKNATLVFLIHGSGGNGLQMSRATGKLDSLATLQNILLVYPNAYKTFWNECRKASTADANIENIDEEAFFRAMIKFFVKKYKVSTYSSFAAGFSGGGHMAYKLAMTMPAEFRAVTAIVANMPDTSNLDCVAKRKPVGMMIINGTADMTNPFDGGDMKSGNVTLGRVRSTERTLDYWKQVNGHEGLPTMDSLPDTDTTDGKTIVQYTYKKDGHMPVILLKVINGRHDYPGDIDVYITAWQFFAGILDRLKRERSAGHAPGN